VLDDRWLIERDYKRKLEVKREVLKPGQKINLLKLGEGPFPLPIGQDPAEVRKQFDVEKIAAAKEDPANTIHLKLTPRKENEQFARRFKTVDVWVALANPFPRRIETIDPKQKTIRTTDLSPKAVNSGLRDEQFKLEPINEKEWQSREEPFSP
jgi:outer membrane lipoprotein-sorting protein